MGYRQKKSIEGEFDRLLRAMVHICRAANPAAPLDCLTAIGGSLHEVQDFYAHSNWVETRFGKRPPSDGPDSPSRGYGTAPTWFDIPLSVRTSARVYTNGPTDGKLDLNDPLFGRKHGNWKSDNNFSLVSSVNTDWDGRPFYVQAYMAADFATRQWIEAVQAGVGDGRFWDRVRSFHPTGKARNDLRHEMRRGTRGMSYWVRHWHGEGDLGSAARPDRAGAPARSP